MRVCKGTYPMSLKIKEVWKVREWTVEKTETSGNNGRQECFCKCDIFTGNWAHLHEDSYLTLKITSSSVHVLKKCWLQIKPGSGHSTAMEFHLYYAPFAPINAIIPSPYVQLANTIHSVQLWD